ncbi:hypothetical protein YC2023_090396 [Brassica napus]
MSLMEAGLLPAAEATKVIEKKLQKTGTFSSPAKPAASIPQEPAPNQNEVTQNQPPRSGRKILKTTDSRDGLLANRVPKKTSAK